MSIARASAPILRNPRRAPDDIPFKVGIDGDGVVWLNSAILNANTAPANGGLVGTPVTQASPANTVFLSNITASGDIVLATNLAGNSLEALRVDASASKIYVGWGGFTTVFKDAMLVTLGTDGDSVFVHDSAGRAANAAFTGVVVGTGVYATVPANSLIVSNVTANGDIVVLLNDTAGNSWEYERYDGSAKLHVWNESGSAINHRFESDNNVNLLVLDGGLDSVAVGAIATSNTFLRVGSTKTVGTSTDHMRPLYFGGLYTAGGTGATAYGMTIWDTNIETPVITTVGQSVAYAAIGTLQIAEPNITLGTGDTATAAFTVRIVNAPTEGSSNYALWVDAGTTRLDGNLDMSDSGLDIVIKAATAAALEISDGTTKFYAFDTRVATVGVTTHALDISDYTLASAAGAVATGWSLAAHTLNYTGSTQVTTQVDTVVIGARTLAGDTATLTVNEANSLMLVAPTEGTNVAITAASGLRIVDAGGTPVNQYGIYIEDLTVGATADYGIYIAGADTAAIYVASADPIHLGVAGASTGKMEIDGATSGTVTLTVAATAGTWTMTLPAAVGGAGEQLTDAAGNGICSWAAAASRRELKELHGLHDAKDALDKVLSTKVYDFNFREGKGTLDSLTNYVGPVADEAPWAMHYNGGIVNPINSLGYTVLAFQAMADEIKALRAKVEALEGKK